MSIEPHLSIQLELFEESPAHQKAIETYEWLRPVLTHQRTLADQSQRLGISYKRLWRYWQRFQQSGFWGLIDGRIRAHRRGKCPVEQIVPRSVQQQVVRLALAHPFSYRELARIVRECYACPVDHQGIGRLLMLHRLPPEVLTHHHQAQQRTTLPPLAPQPQMELPLAPTSQAQRLAQALGSDHLLIRFRTYREYPTPEQARWRIIELLAVGFRPRRVAKLLAIQPPVVYYWKQRFTRAGLPGLTTRQRAGTPITTRVSVQGMMEVFQLLDNNPLLGHYRVKMALDALGYRYGHTTVWQVVAFYKQAHPTPPKEKHTPNPEEQPHQTN